MPPMPPTMYADQDHQLLPPMACISEMSSVGSASYPTSTPANCSNAGLPDPFAVATLNGEQTKTTGVSKRTLNPYWNESFDL